MTSQAPCTAAIDLSQLDSESEDHDALPFGSTAVLLLGAVFAVPVLAVTAAAAPFVWAARSLATHGNSLRKVENR